LAWAGCNLALFNTMLNVCPADHRPTYVALYTALMNVTAFAGPLLGAGLADWIGIRLAFGISGGVRLAGTLLLFLLAR
jgi:MFS family permease